MSGICGQLCNTPEGWDVFGLFKANLSLRLNFVLSDVRWYCHQRPVLFSAVANL